MIVTKNYKIDSCDDAELGLKRSSKLEFFLTYDDSKDIKALVCVIQGCGGDADANYKEHLAFRVAESLPVAVLSVNYFWACVDELTHWTSDEKSPNYFSPSRAQIRDVSRDLDTQAQCKKTVFVGYHSLHDATAPISLKMHFYDKLNALGFKTNLNIISDPKQIDGKFIKNIDHGMDMSIKMLILKELPPLLEMDFKDFDGKKEISYPTDEWIYNFKESDNKLILTCKKSKN